MEESKLDAPQTSKVDMVTRITPDSGTSDENAQHPWDPHKPAFTPLLPKLVRPYPSFEGWFLRLVDFANGFSAGVIMATNYATAESQATLLFSVPAGVGQGFQPERTYSVYARSKESKFIRLPEPNSEESSNGAHEPKGFEWESPNLGRIVARPHEMFMDVTVEGYKFKSHMFNEVPWDSQDSEKGPEGWARRISILPTHWYVYSLGSQATFELSNAEKGLKIEGKGLAHQEKNWGETFPAGHVWMQAFSHDNKSQVVLSGAYFKIGGDTKTPYIFAMGYRSPDLNLDMRTNDPGVVFKDFEILPLEAKFAVNAIGPSHTLQIKCSAPPTSFSDPLLCPIGKLAWEPACRESYCAKLEADVFEHVAWGVIGDSKLVRREVFNHAGLEFGEDLLREAAN
ncbi:hypothetical protein GOP47_0017933 [Adiantum capillus-veneris]|uniref:Tocopherol cyclase n=1 Tax=Adiantum capillus-veneris TaxID=13818 RepID=A0A9D4ZBB4_ADICA|nr:hypothetical protein GOP47_0017933 [Adiantum capillus-veneris]